MPGMLTVYTTMPMHAITAYAYHLALLQNQNTALEVPLILIFAHFTHAKLSPEIVVVAMPSKKNLETSSSALSREQCSAPLAALGGPRPQALTDAVRTPRGSEHYRRKEIGKQSGRKACKEAINAAAQHGQKAD